MGIPHSLAFSMGEGLLNTTCAPEYRGGVAFSGGNNGWSAALKTIWRIVPQFRAADPRMRLRAQT